MGRDALARLFGIVGGFVSLYSLSAWSLSQGGTQLSAVPGLEPRAPVTSAYFAVIIIGVCLGIACLLAIAHVREPVDQTGWRFPIVGLGDAKIGSPDALSTRLYAAFLFAALLLLPAAALVHLSGQLAKDGLIWNEALPAGAAVPAACVLPRLWPFGSCNSALQAAASDIFNAREINEGKITETPARLWLVNRRCDLAWERGMSGPQVAERTKGGGSAVSESEQQSWDALHLQGAEVEKRLVELADGGRSVVAAPLPHFCAGPRDRSAICAADPAECRGVEWKRTWSPLLVLVPSLAAWGALLWLSVVELGWARFGPRNSQGAHDGTG
jgi:hypothetical protein